MSKLIDLTNQRFGQLTVLYKAPNKGQAVYWHCKCDCGNEKDINGSNLRKGLTISCGCYQKEQASKTNQLNTKYDINPGDRFFQLTVLKKLDKGMFLCRCDCGKEIEVYRSRLTSGNIHSCGCRIGMQQYNLINEIGNRYGRLTVIERAGRDKNGNALWRCQCDCGNETIVAGITLRSSGSLSCGCLKSKGEHKIFELLKEHNIIFQREYSFKDLYVNNGLAKFDFAIFDNNNNLLKLIEYQGIQHFNNSNFGKLQRENSDPKKRKYCQKNNIPLIEIPYTDYEKLDWEYLKEKCNL